MNYIYTLFLTEDESGELVGKISAPTEEMLLEKLGHLDKSKEDFEDKHQDYAMDSAGEKEEDDEYVPHDPDETKINPDDIGKPLSEEIH